MVASGAPPDLVYVDREIIGTYAARGAILPLDECVSAAQIDMGQYRPAAVQQVTVDGKVYGIPEFYSGRVMMISNTALKDAGLSLADVDTTSANKVADEQIFGEVYKPSGDAKFDQAVQTVLDVQDVAFATPPSPAGAEFQKAWQDAVNRVLAGARTDRRRGGMSRQETRWAWLFLAPWVIGFLVFAGGPMIASLVLSFTEYDVISAPQFTGLDNYRQLMSDPAVAVGILFLFLIVTFIFEFRAS